MVTWSDDQPVVEVGMAYHVLKQTHPQRHHHFGPASGLNSTEVDDVFRFPAEPLAEICDNLLLGLAIVTTNEQMVIARVRLTDPGMVTLSHPELGLGCSRRLSFTPA
jgi:hypothetical protein